MKLPPIGFGGMPLSIQGRPPEDVGRRVIHAAIDAGMTFLDTASTITGSAPMISDQENNSAYTAAGVPSSVTPSPTAAATRIEITAAPPRWPRVPRRASP